MLGVAGAIAVDDVVHPHHVEATRACDGEDVPARSGILEVVQRELRGGGVSVGRLGQDDGLESRTRNAASGIKRQVRLNQGGGALRAPGAPPPHNGFMLIAFVQKRIGFKRRAPKVACATTDTRWWAGGRALVWWLAPCRPLRRPCPQTQREKGEGRRGGRGEEGASKPVLTGQWCKRCLTSAIAANDMLTNPGFGSARPCPHFAALGPLDVRDSTWVIPS